MSLSGVLLVLCLVAVSCSASGEPTPLLAWSNRGGLPSAGGQYSSVEELLSATDMDSADLFIVFKASKLSFDDIAKYGGAYGGKKSDLDNLQTLVQSAVSNVWTGVKGQPASELVQSLSEGFQSEVTTVKGGGSLPAAEGLAMVELTGTFAEQDAAIAKVIGSVGDAPYVAFYTSDNIQSYLVRQRRDTYDTRVEETASTKCATVVNNTINTACLAACFTGPFLMNLTQNGENTVFHSFNLTEGACEGTGPCEVYGLPCIVLTAHTNTSEAMDFALLFVEGSTNFTSVASYDRLHTGFWRLDLGHEGQRLLRSRSSKRLFEQFAVPNGNSYACSSNSTFNRFEVHNSSAGAGPNDTAVQFSSRLQVQYLGFKAGQTQHSFATSYNCEGYFTIGSWMGTFSSLILIAILYFSIVFMFGIKTIDRFDDPRGPTITIENLH